MSTWFMLTLVGKDRPGIVAKVSEALFQGNYSIGEATMARLGGNFTMMLMVRDGGDQKDLEKRIHDAVADMCLLFHIDAIEGELHHHVDPDVQISIYGADRAGIVAEATGMLAEAGLNILSLETDVGGTEDSPLFIMHIEGVAGKGIEALEKVCQQLAEQKKVETHLSPIDTLMG